MYQNIMVPLDGSKLAECVLPHVESIARGCHVPTVTFVSVVEPLYLPGGMDWTLSEGDRQKWLEQHKADAQVYLDNVVNRLDGSGVNFQTRILVGKVSDTLIDFAVKNPVDLIIIATHGRSGISRWVWGSTADRIIRSVRTPTLLIRAPGYIEK